MSAIEKANKKRLRKKTKNILDAYRRYYGNPIRGDFPNIALKATIVWRRRLIDAGKAKQPDPTLDFW